MVSLKLCDCECCSALSPLGSLPVLKKLSIEGFNDVVNVDKEFYRNDSITTTPFKSLETLTFKTMPKWKEWATFEGDIFSTLRELHIINCPVLIGNLPKTLPSLTVLEITNCKPLVASLSSFMALRELHLTDCDKVQLRKVPTSLQSLTIGGCHTPLPMGGLPGTLKSLVIYGILQLSRDYSYPSVETLKVKKGPGLLWSLPLELFPKLKRVEMLDCEHLQYLSILEQSCQSLTTLTCLEIKNCRNFVSFPCIGLCAPNLRKIEVSDCQKLKSLPDSMHTLLPSLMALILIRCPELESVAGCSFPSNLQKLEISYCDNFFPSYMQWSLQSLHSLKEFIIAYQGKKVDSFPSKASLPSSLIRFSILTFQNLKLLDGKGLQHLTSLQELSIIWCKNLESLPEQGLPDSLSFLYILTSAVS